MGTRLEFFKGKLKLFSFLFLILLILFVNLGPTFAISRGDYLKDTTEGNKKEEQLLRKIEIIHETFHYLSQLLKTSLYNTDSKLRYAYSQTLEELRKMVFDNYNLVHKLYLRIF